MIKFHVVREKKLVLALILSVFVSKNEVNIEKF
jgi:hypothetical protein